MRVYIVISVLLCGLCSTAALGAAPNPKQIRTNEVTIHNPPNWLKQSRVERVTGRIQHKLEWSTRRVDVHWHSTASTFAKAHGLGPMATAVTITSGGTSSVHMGPLVTDANFDEVFGHELVHVIIGQKYKDAIPQWLEEGLANHLANRGKVDYKWLASRPFPQDVRELAHPFKGNATSIGYRYKASQAFAEMLAKKCDLENLIRLSVKRKMEDYMVRTCELKDLNAAFKKWVQDRAKSGI